MGKEREIDCRQCGEKSTLEDRVMLDGCCWVCGAEIDLEDYLARAMDERDRLRAEAELLRMQLAACGVVAMSNTPESAGWARDMHPDYMSASCQDVMRAVDREMALRAEVEALRKDAERYRQAMVEVMRQVDGNIRETVRDCVNGGHDVQDIYDYCDLIEEAIDAAMAGKGAAK